MINSIVAKYGLIATTALSAVHFGARGIVFTEELAMEHYRTTQAELIDIAALKLGYEKTQPAVPEATIEEVIDREAALRGISPVLVRALIHTESKGNDNAQSPAGAIGRMQVMPANAKRCRMTIGELYEPKKNVQCGIRILSEELKTYGGDTQKALWSYNGGPGGVKQITKCGPYLPNGAFNESCLSGYKESAYYTKKVLARLATGEEG